MKLVNFRVIVAFITAHAQSKMLRYHVKVKRKVYSLRYSRLIYLRSIFHSAFKRPSEIREKESTTSILKSVKINEQEIRQRRCRYYKVERYLRCTMSPYRSVALTEHGAQAKMYISLTLPGHPVTLSPSHLFNYYR